MSSNSENSDSQDISKSPSILSESDAESDNTSIRSVEVTTSPRATPTSEHRVDSQNGCSTSGRQDVEPAIHASPLKMVLGQAGALGQYGTMRGLAEHSPELFPAGSSPVRRSTFEVGETSHRPVPREIPASPVHSDAVESVEKYVAGTDEESTTLEAESDSDQEDPPEIIPEDSDEDALAELYMPPSDEGCAGSVQLDIGWAKTCRQSKFLIKGPQYFAFPDDYTLVLPAEGSRVTDCPSGHVAIYAHMLDFGLRFPLDPFFVKVFKAWNICLAQLTPLGWRNLMAYAWVVRYKGFPETLNLFRKLHWIKEDGSAKGKGAGKKRKSRDDELEGRGGWMSIYTKAGKLTVYPKPSSLKLWRGRFFWVRVPDDFPLRRQWTKPRSRMEHIRDRGLTRRERVAFDYFASDSIPALRGKKRVPVPKYWLPHTNYIFTNPALSALGFCRADPYGVFCFCFYCYISALISVF